MVICLAGILFILIRKFPEVASVVNDDRTGFLVEKKKLIQNKPKEKEQFIESKEEPKVEEIELKYSEKVEKILSEARELLGQKKEHLAEDKLIEAIKIDLRCADAYSLLGDIYFSRKRHIESRESYQAAIRYDENQGAAHYGLALILESENRLNDATNEVLAATRIDPKNDIWLKKLADLYMDLRMYAKAVNIYKKAFACRPDYHLYQELASKAELKLRAHKPNVRS